MKHKDGLDIAALLLLLLVAIAAMVVPVALTQPALLAVPAVLVLITLCVVLYQRRACARFWPGSFAAPILRTVVSSTAWQICPSPRCLSTTGAFCGTTSISGRMC